MSVRLLNVCDADSENRVPRFRGDDPVKERPCP